MSATPKKLNYDDLARDFVNREYARQLPQKALKAALDAGTLWRGLRAETALYADYQNAAVLRPDDIAGILPAGYYAALPAEQRKKLRAAVRLEDAARRSVLRELQYLIDVQCASIAAGTPAFQAAYETRLAEYLSEPLPA